MPRARLLRQRLLALFAVALLLLFSPIVLLFESAGTWLGVPVVILYLFGVWGGVIAMAAWLLTRSSDW